MKPWRMNRAIELTKRRTSKGGSSKHCNCNRTVNRVPEISQGTANDGNRRATKDPNQEPAHHDCLQVLGHSDGDLKDGENSIAKEQGQPAAVQFRQRRPSHGAHGESKHNQTSRKGHDFRGDVEFLGGHRGGGREDATREGHPYGHEGHGHCHCPFAPERHIVRVLRIVWAIPAYQVGIAIFGVLCRLGIVLVVLLDGFGGFHGVLLRVSVHDILLLGIF